jgi:hypothetical protein
MGQSACEGQEHCAGYQTLLKRDIPWVELPDRAGMLRVIAGV